MTDVYERLAKKLDEMPSGFPATEDGLELKILRNVFEPAEAEIALKLRPMPETVETIAERLGKSVLDMQDILDKMVKKGQIASARMSGKDIYILLPFVVGIYELQLNNMDKEFAVLFEEYLPTLMRTLGGFEPAVARVVPVGAEIDRDLYVFRYEDVRRMIEEAKSFQLADCVCRQARSLEGKPCSHTMEACLFFSNEEDAYNEKYLRGRVISREEAMAVLDRSEEEGLVHCTYNLEDGQNFVCNCCSCACVGLRSLKEFNAPYLLAKSNFSASIDPETCESCGVCADERCPMDAIAEKDDGYEVLAERCIGCGVCVSTCPTESISLQRKSAPEQDTPPANLIDWRLKRAAARGIGMRLE